MDNLKAQGQLEKTDFKYFDNRSQVLFFKNTYWKVTAEGIDSFVPGDFYSQAPESLIIPHKVYLVRPAFKIVQNEDQEYDIIINHQDCIYFNFLIQTSRVHWKDEQVLVSKLPEDQRQTYISNNHYKIDGELLSEQQIWEQKQHLINKIFALGYLMHRHKDRAKAWCVTAVDQFMDAKGRGCGGTGKSLCFNYALSQVLRNGYYLNGHDQNRLNDHFVFGGLRDLHQFILVDDAGDKFSLERFFYLITGDLVVHPQGKQPFIIPFEKTGKLVVVKNIARPIEASAERRTLKVVFSDYYHVQNSHTGYQVTRTPQDDFGKILFRDFDDFDWNHFMNTMGNCLAFSLGCPIKFDAPGGDSFKNIEIKRAYRSGLFINQGSVWDIKIHLQNHPGRYSHKQLYEELDRETITRNRSTVKKMISSMIKKMERAIKNA